jgi:mono/diheme cytochrome c family protein
MKRHAVIAMLLGVTTVAGAAERASPEQRGKAMVQATCAQCHAVGRTGDSPHPGAPPFRDLSRRLDLDHLIERLRDRLMVAHPDMPTFRFARQDARAVVAYLRSIQAQ